MRRRTLAVLAIALALPLGAKGAERMTDEQVKKLIEDIDTLKGRFKPSYAASLEARTLLRRGSDVVLHNQRAGRTPTSSFSVLAQKLEALAHAYQLGWPVQSMSVQALRLNDGELAGKVQLVQDSAKRLRGEADKAARANKSIDKATRQSLKTSTQQLEEKAKEVGSRIKGDRPAAVEVDQLLSQAGTLKQTLAQLQLSSAQGPAWRGIESGTGALARAFDAKK